MIATIGFTVPGNTGYRTIFDNDEGPTETYYFSDSSYPVELYYRELSHQELSHQELVNIENAARSIEAVAYMARHYTCKIISKVAGVRVFSVIKMMFSRSGYLPWRIRNKRKSK